ncbi:guanylate cyclase [Plakobranchus ocellatus]|uniref:Guanylate cyclase n=1 Tax=Plakobranchus ocellatus TaxID=259542 RepID=A0AAV4C5C2_9GAST|nr:guanylate cyclase [Plakobranchus ocellatus]
MERNEKPQIGDPPQIKTSVSKDGPDMLYEGDQDFRDRCPQSSGSRSSQLNTRFHSCYGIHPDRANRLQNESKASRNRVVPDKIICDSRVPVRLEADISDGRGEEQYRTNEDTATLGRPLLGQRTRICSPMILLNLKPALYICNTAVGNVLEVLIPTKRHIRKSLVLFPLILLLLLTTSPSSCGAQSNPDPPSGSLEVATNSSPSVSYSVQKRHQLQFPDVLHLGLLLPFDENYEFNLKRVEPAVEIASETIRERKLLPTVGRIEIIPRDSHHSGAYGPLAAMQIVKERLVHVFFGPVSPDALSPVALYCNKWRLPIISPGGRVIEFSDKSEYRMLTRMWLNFGQSSAAIAQLLVYFNITTVGFMYHSRGENQRSDYYDILKPVYDKTQERSKKSVEEIYSEHFDANKNDNNFTVMLQEASMKCRIHNKVISGFQTLCQAKSEGGGVRTRNRKLPADLKAYSLSTMPPTPQI